METMFCKKCGSPIQEGVKFCRKCGSPVSAWEAEASESMQTGGEEVSESPAPSPQTESPAWQPQTAQAPYSVPPSQKKSTQKKNCIKCGAENSYEAVFCGVCGAKLENLQEKEEKVLHLEQEMRKLEEKKERQEEEAIALQEQIGRAEERVKKLKEEKNRLMRLLLPEGEEI